MICLSTSACKVLLMILTGDSKVGRRERTQLAHQSKFYIGVFGNVWLWAFTPIGICLNRIYHVPVNSSLVHSSHSIWLLFLQDAWPKNFEKFRLKDALLVSPLCGSCQCLRSWTTSTRVSLFRNYATRGQWLCKMAVYNRGHGRFPVSGAFWTSILMLSCFDHQPRARSTLFNSDSMRNTPFPPQPFSL